LGSRRLLTRRFPAKRVAQQLRADPAIEAVTQVLIVIVAKTAFTGAVALGGARVQKAQSVIEDLAKMSTCELGVPCTAGEGVVQINVEMQGSRGVLGNDAESRAELGGIKVKLRMPACGQAQRLGNGVKAVFERTSKTQEEAIKRIQIRCPLRARLLMTNWCFSNKDSARILLENYYLPGDLENQIEAFVANYNHRRYHESIDNLTPADYFGRGQTILLERERIKRKTIQIVDCYTADKPRNIKPR
jgi:hypothetical protein